MAGSERRSISPGRTNPTLGAIVGTKRSGARTGPVRESARIEVILDTVLSDAVTDSDDSIDTASDLVTEPLESRTATGELGRTEGGGRRAEEAGGGRRADEGGGWSGGWPWRRPERDSPDHGSRADIGMRMQTKPIFMKT